MRNRTYMLHCKMVIELRYEILCSDYMLSGFSNFADQHPLLLFVMCFFFLHSCWDFGVQCCYILSDIWNPGGEGLD